MHQPEYRSYADGVYQLPWVYLHAIKDYIDMAAIIEATPGARAVINFVPILLDQIEDYAADIHAFFSARTPIRDPLLAALAESEFPLEHERRLALIRACLRANEKRLIQRFPAYRRLVDMTGLLKDNPEDIAYFSDQYLADIVTWYHLAWLGETVRRDDARVRHLMKKASFFSHEDRLQLLEIIGQIVGAIVERYRVLAQSGRVELSMTPYAHPMLPLLLDFSSAREAVPEMPLPSAPCYPGGLERAHWHLSQGIRSFEHHFGFRPQGCWPAEGGVSAAALALLGEYGFRWTATGASVLGNSLANTDRLQSDSGAFHRAYRIDDAGPACFFRDDGLSDLIGFTYHDWHGDDAVANLMHHMENIAHARPGDDNRVVSIVLDGENAWEAYPENGYHFITALYRQLAGHPDIELTTFSDCLAQGLAPVGLEKLVAGSWVYGNFSTWMGDKDKNQGWDLLCQAKAAYDRVIAEDRLDEVSRERALWQLAVCEGSDWCWWFGDYNPSDSVGDFERLYRLHLSNLYRFLGLEPPQNLLQIISTGGGYAEQGGVMRRGQAGP
ncbi:MAG: glycoside hydrolase [Chromatiales bacterium]|jgi:alpha-amylase/alpha-mannosidase (GH57 family)|nr:glycoside hydrolase [Chromatiales bacterium]